MIITTRKDELVILGAISALTRALALTAIAFVGVAVVGLSWREVCGAVVLIVAVVEAHADARRESFVWRCSDCGGVYHVSPRSMPPYRACSHPNPPEMPS